MSSKIPLALGFDPGRKGFMDWIGKKPIPNWKNLPLTHITRGVVAEDIVRSGKIETNDPGKFVTPVSYLFYGRPAFKLSGDSLLKAEAFCPFCFIFRPDLLVEARAVHAFDTGAFEKRLYKHVIADEMNVNDFMLTGATSPNQLISLVFGSKENYMKGDLLRSPSPTAQSSEFHAKSYLDLIYSPGRNEPDDRIFSIEAVFSSPIALTENLIAIVLPHTLCIEEPLAPWLFDMKNSNIDLLPYEFWPGRHPEHYYTLLEQQVMDYYKRKDYL